MIEKSSACFGNVRYEKAVIDNIYYERYVILNEGVVIVGAEKTEDGNDNTCMWEYR